MKHSVLFTLTLLGSFSFSQLNAASLSEVYQLALENDAQLKAAESTYLANKEQLPQARSGLLPSINLSANSRYTDSNSNNYNNHGYTLSLSQPVFNATSWFTFKRGQLLNEKAELEFSQTQQNLILETVTAYLTVLNAESELTNSQAQLRAAQHRLDQVKAQFDVGLIAITDVQEAQANFDNTQVAVIGATMALDNSLESLERLTGTTVDQFNRLDENYPILAPEPSTPASWLSKAEQDNLALKLAQINVESSLKTEQINRSGHYPTVNFNAVYDYDKGNASSRSDYDTRYLELSLNMPLFSGGATQSKIRESEHRKVAAQQSLIYQKRLVKQNTRSLLRALTTDVSNVAARLQSIHSSESALHATEEGYKAGTRNLVDVIQAEQQLYAAKKEYAKARLGYVENLFNFKQQIGTLNPADVEALNGWLK